MWIPFAVATADTLALRDVAADACGTVTGTLDVRRAFFPRSVRLAAGAAAVDVAVPAFATAVPFAVEVGRDAPAATLAAEWWFVSSDPVTVALPPLAPVVTLRAPAEAWADERFPVEVSVTTACDRLPIGVELVDGDGERLAAAPPSAGPRALEVSLPRPGRATLAAVAFDGAREIGRASRGVGVGPPCVDRDGDGHLACRRGDCDDADPAVFPGAAEVRGNRRDDDCDGVNGQDDDRDGFEAASAGGDDCDDRRGWVFPGATAYPDADGDGATPWRVDLDRDCDGAPDPVPAFDCADDDPRIPRAEDPNPNQVDEDCDGIVDEGTVAYDDDGDGLAELAGDCDDADPSVRPGRAETPDCRDEDCDGVVDEGLVRRAVDDGHEPNDDAPVALPGPTWIRGFFGGRWSGSSSRIAGVTRDLGDVERFVLTAHDGTFDTFHVTVTIARMGDDRAYDVSIRGPGGDVRQVLDGPGSVSVGGAGGRDDSGLYEITVTPVEGALDWCPIAFTVSSG